MSGEWDKLYRTISNKNMKDFEFRELDKIHKPIWWDEFHQYDIDGNIKDSRLRLKLFNMAEVGYSVIESLPAGSFYIVSVTQSHKVSYYINLRIATAGKWQTMLRLMGGPNYTLWQNSPITYFNWPPPSYKVYKYYLIENEAKFINWPQTNPFEVKL